MTKEPVKVGIVAAVAIKHDGKYLLVQEKQEKVYGLWNFPAGHVDVGETIEEAAIREAKEESGYDVRLIRKVDIFQVNSTEMIKHAFEGEIIGGELNFPEDEILNASWFTYDEISEMKEKLRGSWIYETIKILEAR
jgi:8-oxo-dGTP diphosphatase